MRDEDPLDTQPGANPDITTHSGGITFEMHTVGNDDRLVIRCDDDGEVWVSLQSEFEEYVRTHGMRQRQ